MKKFTLTLVGFVAGALLFIGAYGISSASETSNPKTGMELATNAKDQRLAYTVYYRSRCYKVRRCVRVNRFGQCKRWRWVTVCPDRRI
ncbi:MAG: hypothetical protein V1897_18610 [Pseudomonadota bacterium]